MSGDLHKDNASSLPLGLVGMYEEALPPASSVIERRKFLEFFAVWALLKKEVSVVFLMTLLEGWSEETIIYYINKYSKWFNSPQNGKYVLYHERLRAFILQKISKKQFYTCNETIIKVAHGALSRRSGDEWERYALEYLSNHMLIPSIEKGDAFSLKSLSNDTTHWKRQIKISKGFEWSKRMLNDMMLWASKFDDDGVIECALNKVDLLHLEQNDALGILEFISQGEIEIALQRIDYFNTTNTSIGIQKKFILFYLILLDVINNNQDEQSKKKNIDVILNKLDLSIPKDLKVFDFSNFFPIELMLLLTDSLIKLDVNIYRILQKSSEFQNEIEYYSLDNFFKIKEFNCKRPNEISISENVFQASLDIASKSSAFYKIFKKKKSIQFLQKAIETAESILYEYDGLGIPELCQQGAYLKIAVEMAYQKYSIVEIKNIVMKSLVIELNFLKREKTRFLDELENFNISPKLIDKKFLLNNTNKILISRNKWVNSVNDCLTIEELLLLIKKEEAQLEYTIPSICRWIYERYGYDYELIFYRDFQKNLLAFNFTENEIEKCRGYFFNGLVTVLESEGFTRKNTANVLKIFYTNSNFLTLLKSYILFQIRNDQLKKEEKERFNRTFNIQWAIDIKNSFSASKS
jgi:hypothetical protein